MMEILDNYIHELMEQSTPQAPIWNLETTLKGIENHWDYINGCVLRAILELYNVTKKAKYLEFADNFADYFVNEDGSIRSFDTEDFNLDTIMPGRTLFDLYKLTKKEKYKKALDTVYNRLIRHPRTKSGNFWHKDIYPNQIWLDGLYMAQPFYMQYEVEYNNCKNCDDSYEQFLNVFKLMRDERNGLYYHAYDESREMFWCDKVTGLSGCSWLRALGWYAMALIDTMEHMPEHMAKQKAEMNRIYKELIDSVLKYQDESGMWYQVINFGGIEPNYLETSGSAIFAYAILKSVRLGYLSKEYGQYGEKAFYGTCDRYLSEKDGKLQLGGICLVAGLGNIENREGTFEYYMREAIVENEAKGVAPLILAYIEILYLQK